MRAHLLPRRLAALSLLSPPAALSLLSPPALSSSRRCSRSKSLSHRHLSSEHGPSLDTASAVELHVKEMCSDSPDCRTRTPILFCHGLFGSGGNFRSLAKNVGERLDVPIGLVDMRNHGTSPRRQTMSYLELASDIVRTIKTKYGGQPVNLVGHSMGGKAALVVALMEPSLVKSLIAVDIAPVVYAPSESIGSVLRAMKGVPLDGTVRTVLDLNAHLAKHIDSEPVRQFAATNFVRGKKGEKPFWRVNLDVVEASLPELRSFPQFLVDGQHSSPVKTLFLYGTRSDYLTDAMRPQVERLFPNSSFVPLDAGHWVHAEKRVDFVNIVSDTFAHDTDA